MNHVPKDEAIKGAFFGALVGDALCLGSHYEYDAAKILGPSGIFMGEAVTHRSRSR